MGVFGRSLCDEALRFPSCISVACWVTLCHCIIAKKKPTVQKIEETNKNIQIASIKVHVRGAVPWLVCFNLVELVIKEASHMPFSPLCLEAHFLILHDPTEIKAEGHCFSSEVYISP